MFSIHWPRVNYEKVEKTERPLSALERQARHIREAYVTIAALYTLLLLIIWSAVEL